MANEHAITALREIAFGENSSAKDRISACSSLFKNDVDVLSVKQMLEYILQQGDVSDKDRVSAGTLLLHIDKSCNAQPREEVDEDTVATALKQQYLRFG